MLHGLRLRRLHRGRVLAAVHELLEPFGAEPGYEVVTVGDHGNSDPTAQRAPLSQGFNVLCDVEPLEGVDVGLLVLREDAADYRSSRAFAL